MSSLLEYLVVTFLTGCFIQFVSVCLREACEAALEEKHVLDISRTEEFSDEATCTHFRQIEALRQVFQRVAEADTPTEVRVVGFVLFILLVFSLN